MYISKCVCVWVCFFFSLSHQKICTQMFVGCTFVHGTLADLFCWLSKHRICQANVPDMPKIWKWTVDFGLVRMALKKSASTLTTTTATSQPPHRRHNAVLFRKCGRFPFLWRLFLSSSHQTLVESWFWNFDGVIIIGNMCNSIINSF